MTSPELLRLTSTRHQNHPFQVLLSTFNLIWIVARKLKKHKENPTNLSVALSQVVVGLIKDLSKS